MSQDDELIIPTVHTNGTSRDDLVGQLQGVYLALNKAIDLLALATPHGRDYYPQGDGVWFKAKQMHDERTSKLYSVRDDMVAIGLEIE